MTTDDLVAHLKGAAASATAVLGRLGGRCAEAGRRAWESLMPRTPAGVGAGPLEEPLSDNAPPLPGTSDRAFRIGLVVVYTAMGLPSAVFILTGYLRSLPQELEESARIDGASEARIMWSVMLPLARPAMVIAAINNAVPIWNDFFFPLVFIQTDARKTLPQGLTIFMGEYNTEWGVLFAGLTIAALPITLLYILLSRQFVAGMTQGAVK